MTEEERSQESQERWKKVRNVVKEKGKEVLVVRKNP